MSTGSYIKKESHDVLNFQDELIRGLVRVLDKEVAKEVTDVIFSVSILLV